MSSVTETHQEHTVRIAGRATTNSQRYKTKSSKKHHLQEHPNSTKVEVKAKVYGFKA